MRVLTPVLDTVEASTQAASRAAEARAKMVTKIVAVALILLFLLIAFALNPLYAVALVVLGLVAFWIYTEQM